jgi:hypothetical protein
MRASSARCWWMLSFHEGFMTLPSFLDESTDAFSMRLALLLFI